ncbi:hypothetical protein Pmani_028245, partial [Petrolisthes manimaculis]
VVLVSVAWRRDSTPNAFSLPSNASIVLGGVVTGFDCADLPYGYYADENNDCAVFHVCLPYIDHNQYVTPPLLLPVW